MWLSVFGLVDQNVLQKQLNMLVKLFTWQMQCGCMHISQFHHISQHFIEQSWYRISWRPMANPSYYNSVPRNFIQIQQNDWTALPSVHRDHLGTGRIKHPSLDGKGQKKTFVNGRNRHVDRYQCRTFLNWLFPSPCPYPRPAYPTSDVYSFCSLSIFSSLVFYMISFQAKILKNTNHLFQYLKKKSV